MDVDHAKKKKKSRTLMKGPIHKKYLHLMGGGAISLLLLFLYSGALYILHT